MNCRYSGGGKLENSTIVVCRTSVRTSYEVFREFSLRMNTNTCLGQQLQKLCVGVCIKNKDIVDTMYSLTGVDGVGVAVYPLWQRETEEKREAKDEEIP